MLSLSRKGCTERVECGRRRRTLPYGRGSDWGFHTVLIGLTHGSINTIKRRGVSGRGRPVGTGARQQEDAGGAIPGGGSTDEIGGFRGNIVQFRVFGFGTFIVN